MPAKKHRSERKPKPSGRVMGRSLDSIVGRLVVLQSEDLKDPMTEVPETASIDGTFDTMERVEQFIRADTQEWFTPDGMHEGRNGEQTAPIYICQVLRVVKAVPIVNLSVAIEEAQTPNPSRQDQAARKEL